MTKLITDNHQGNNYKYARIDLGDEALATTVETLLRHAGVNVQKYYSTKKTVVLKIEEEKVID